MVEVRVHLDDNTYTYSENFTVIPYWQPFCPMQPIPIAYRTHRFTDISSHIIQLSSQYMYSPIYIGTNFDCHSMITDIL